VSAYSFDGVFLIWLFFKGWRKPWPDQKQRGLCQYKGKHECIWRLRDCCQGFSFKEGTVFSENDTVLQCVGIEFYNRAGAEGYVFYSTGNMLLSDVFWG